MIRCLAIDDEKLVLDLLVDNIRQVPFLHLVKACRNAMEAMAVLQEEKIDLIFADIQMPGLNGLQFIQSLAQPPLVILITAYEQYALEGYNLNVIDYLLKPVSFGRFLKACDKAREQFTLRAGHARTANESPEFLFVNVEYTLVKVPITDILFVEGLKDYIRIHLVSSHRPVITKMSLKAIEQKLPPARFVRIHKSYIVSIPHITVIKRDLVCIGKEELPLSESCKETLQKMINR